MSIQINFKGITTESFSVSVNNENYVVNDDSPNIYISDSLYCATPVTVSMIKSPKPGFVSWLIWALTIGIQGIFHILLINTDADWRKNISPYIVIASFAVDDGVTTDISIGYDVKGEFKIIKMNFDTSVNDVNIRYIFNPDELKNVYITYVRRICSVSFVSLFLFTYLLIIAIINNNVLCALICGIVCAGTVAIALYLIITEYKKIRAIPHD